MTPEQRRVATAVCVCVGLTFLVSAGLPFLAEPMSEDLRISDAGVEVMLSVPSIASLTVIFVAGQTGDRLGHRRTLLLLIGGFIAGSLLCAGAQEVVGVIGGLALCGGAATAVQIVALSLLQESFPEGRARVSAYTTFGMVYPLAFMVFPVLTGGLLDVAAWRLIPLIWALAGAVMAAVVFFLVSPTPVHRPMGEWLTLLLAGIALAAGVRFVDSLGRKGVTAPGTLIAVMVLTASLIALTVRLRTVADPGFSVAPLRGYRTSALLFAVSVVALIESVPFVVLAFEYLYDMSALKAAIVVIPARVGAVLGAKILAGIAINRWGVARAGRNLLAVLSISLLSLLGMQPDTPAWYLMGCVVLFMTAGATAIAVLNADVMSYAPPGRPGPISAMRGAAIEIGGGLSVVVLGASVITAVNMSGGAGAVGADQIRQLAGGLRLDGILGFIAVLAAWLALTMVARKPGSPPTSRVSP